MIKVTEENVKQMPLVLRAHVEVSTTEGIAGKTIISFLVKHEHDEFVTYQVYEMLTNGKLQFWGDEWFYNLTEALEWLKVNELAESTNWIDD